MEARPPAVLTSGRPSGRSPEPSWGRDLALLAFALAAFFGPLLGVRALWSPDEGRYAEIPREMVASGDWVTPRLDGIKYFEKPALFYWLQAIAIELFGLREWALRLWLAVFAAAGCLAVYAAGRRLFGRRAGLLAAAVLATSPLYYFLSQSLTLDMAVSVLLSATLLAALLGLEAPAGGGRRTLLWSAYAGAALATLTKGLIGFLLPGLIVLVWVALLRRWRQLRPLYLPSGVAIFLAVALPWHVLVARANPGFLHFYFVHEQLLRYATTIHARYQPFWFFVPVLLAGMVPWTAFLPRALALRRGDPGRPGAIFLVLWAGLVLAFFSASSSKLIPYILPCAPPLALLVGRALDQAWDEGRGRLRGAYAFLLASGVGLAIAIAAAPRALAGNREAAHAIGLLGGGLYAAAAAFAVAGLAPFALHRAGRPRAAIVAIVAATAVVLATLAVLAPAFDSERSVKSLAEFLRPRLRPGDEVAAYHDYPQDLPVYLGRTITVAGYQGELEVGLHGEDTSAWIIDEPTFWRRWAEPRRMYAVIEAARYAKLVEEGRAMALLARSGGHVLVANRAAAGSAVEPSP
jgi:4-amino-4-deoxy-L-arabinose transferase-like glycosyltransferase